MKKIIILAKKELLSYLSSPLGYMFAAVLMVVVNWLYFNDLFIIGQADLSGYWSSLTFLMSIFVPAICMGVVADEKKNGTWEAILSLPINETQLIAGKFLGSLLYLILVIMLSLPTIVTVGFLGSLETGLVLSGMLATILLTAAYLALGIFMSSLTDQAIVAFLLTTVILLLNGLLGQQVLLARVPTQVGQVMANLSLTYRASRFWSGLLEVKDLIFFGSWIFIFLNLSVLRLKIRNK